jgi:hypothetical protein
LPAQGKENILDSKLGEINKRIISTHPKKKTKKKNVTTQLEKALTGYVFPIVVSTEER